MTDVQEPAAPSRRRSSRVGASGPEPAATRQPAPKSAATPRRPTTPRRAAAPAAEVGASTELTERLTRLQAAAVAELERRRDAAGLEPADSLPVDVRGLSSVSRDLPALLRNLPHLAALGARLAADGGLRDAVRGTVAFIARQRELGGRIERGEDVFDDFGFDREWTESILPLFRFLYHHWWRVHTEGLGNVPMQGRALLVSNHAGVLPYDGAMIRMACFDEHPGHRHARALILNAFFGVPVASWFLRRTGNTLAHPGDAERLLADDQLVLVFPEGAKGTGKAYGDRYRLRRFGRGGFVSLALHTGAPIIPVSVVGSEEIHPMLANLTPIADALGLPYFPLTPTFPLLGPLGFVPFPSTWRIRFHAPIETASLGAASGDDPATVMQLSDRVRDTIQAGIYDLLVERGSVFA